MKRTNKIKWKPSATIIQTLKYAILSYMIFHLLIFISDESCHFVSFATDCHGAAPVAEAVRQHGDRHCDRKNGYLLAVAEIYLGRDGQKN